MPCCALMQEAPTAPSDADPSQPAVSELTSGDGNDIANADIQDTVKVRVDRVRIHEHEQCCHDDCVTPRADAQVQLSSRLLLDRAIMHSGHHSVG